MVMPTVTAETWCGEIVTELGGKLCEGATAELAKGEITGGEDRFPIKLKDEALQKSIQFLVKIGVFPDKDDDSEDEMVFGDDDFPCDQDEAPPPLPPSTRREGAEGDQEGRRQEGLRNRRGGRHGRYVVHELLPRLHGPRRQDYRRGRADGHRPGRDEPTGGPRGRGGQGRIRTRGEGVVQLRE